MPSCDYASTRIRKNLCPFSVDFLGAGVTFYAFGCHLMDSKGFLHTVDTQQSSVKSSHKASHKEPPNAKTASLRMKLSEPLKAALNTLWHCIAQMSR